MPYTYCFVPLCKSTSIKTPTKRFITVPLNTTVRKKWFKTCRKTFFSANTTFYCCEDHFDEHDFSNIQKHKLMGSRLKVKDGVLPHIFNCHPSRKATHVKRKPSAYLERKKMKEILATIDLQPTVLLKPLSVNIELPKKSSQESFLLPGDTPSHLPDNSPEANSTPPESSPLSSLEIKIEIAEQSSQPALPTIISVSECSESPVGSQTSFILPDDLSLPSCLPGTSSAVSLESPLLTSLEIKKEIEETLPFETPDNEVLVLENSRNDQRSLVHTMTSPRSGNRSAYHHLVVKRKTKSSVWEYFGLPANESGHIINENTAFCKLCSMAVSSKGGNTSNLMSHIKRHHSKKSRNLPPSSSSSKRTISDTSVCNEDADDPLSEEQGNEASTVENERKKQKMILVLQPLGSSSAELCTQSITKFLATCMQPYAIVDNPNFRHMIKTLNPRYELPGMNFFSTNKIPKLYSDTVEKIKCEISRVCQSKLAITTDCWTSVSDTPFVAITVHFVTPEWDLKNVCLNCKHFEEDHTAENISEMLTNTLSEWKISVENLSICITDNGSNILEAVRQLKLPHVSCFGHNINIAVNRALQINQLKIAISRLKSLQSSIFCEFKMQLKVHRAQELLQMNKAALPNACPTRWLSTLKLCQRFLENEGLISEMLLYYPSKTHLMLEGTDKVAVQDFVSATTLLEDITKTLSESDYVPASSVLPLFKQIKKSLQPRERDSILLLEIKREILGALSEIYESKSIVSILNLSTFCDPRFRLRFLEDPKTVREAAIKKMANLQDSLHDASVESDTQPVINRTKKGLEKFFELEDEEENSEADSLKSVSVLRAEREIEDYLSMPRVGFNDDPLSWWKSHEISFPLLKLLARQYLAIPGTSVPSESIFSTAGSIITEQRALLLPENAEMQVFLAKNYKFI